ncbi:MAG: hypothetical protein JXJ17_07945 [Anaerolineae bacterium]|nr:hypothetical protein [Anaerolineae bacterium]
MNKTVGIILIVAATIVLLIGSVWIAATVAEGSLRVSGAAVGFALLNVVLVIPLLAGGILVLSRAKREVVDEEESKELRTILDAVKTRGQVEISQLVIDLQSDRETVRDQIYQLVGMGIFEGYVNWDEGVLYSEDAAELRNLEECKNCNGKLSLVGKGIVACPFCGTEYFLP